MKKIMVVVLVGMMAGSAAAGELTTEQKRTCNNMQNAGALMARALSQASKQDVQAEINKESNPLYREVNTNILTHMKSTNVYDLEKLSQQECAKAVVKYSDEQLKGFANAANAKFKADIEAAHKAQLEEDKANRAYASEPSTVKKSAAELHQEEVAAQTRANREKEIKESQERAAQNRANMNSRRELYLDCMKGYPTEGPEYRARVKYCTGLIK